MGLSCTFSLKPIRCVASKKSNLAMENPQERNRDFDRTCIFWDIFNCHVWLPEGHASKENLNHQEQGLKPSKIWTEPSNIESYRRFQPLWKMMEWKSVGMMTFPSEWKVIIQSCSSHHQPVLWLVGGWEEAGHLWGVGWIPMNSVIPTNLGFKFIQPAKSMQDMKEQVTNSVVFLESFGNYTTFAHAHLWHFGHVLRETVKRKDI